MGAMEQKPADDWAAEKALNIFKFDGYINVEKLLLRTAAALREERTVARINAQYVDGVAELRRSLLEMESTARGFLDVWTHIGEAAFATSEARNRLRRATFFARKVLNLDEHGHASVVRPGYENQVAAGADKVTVAAAKSETVELGAQARVHGIAEPTNTVVLSRARNELRDASRISCGLVDESVLRFLEIFINAKITAVLALKPDPWSGSPGGPAQGDPLDDVDGNVLNAVTNAIQSCGAKGTDSWDTARHAAKAAIRVLKLIGHFVDRSTHLGDTAERRHERQ